MSILNVEILGSSGQTLNIESLKIYSDDNIQTIKNKIVIALDYKVSYEEIYIYSKSGSNHMDHKTIYKSLVDDDMEFLSKENYELFLKNFDQADAVDMDIIHYEEFIKFPLLVKKCLVGSRMKKDNYMLPVDPFDCNKKNIFEESLYNLENNVLLDFSDSSTLYLCLAADVLNELNLSDSEKSKVLSIYYPFLFKKGIKSASDLTDKRIELIDNTKKSISIQLKKVYEMVDSFMNIRNISPEPFDYNTKKISYFRFVIDGTSHLPLDAIFKNIHATENVPFIKYSPNVKRDSLYRLYSNGTAKSGRKIPFLNGAEILKSAKELGQKDEISLMLKHSYKSKPIKIYLHIRSNGKLCVECSFSKDIQIDDILKIEEIMHEGVNPTIQDVNKYLEPFGYSLGTFIDMNAVKIESITYNTSIKINKALDFSKYQTFMMPIFSFKNDVSTDDKTILYFKKVNNYVEMDPMEDFVLNTYKQTQSLEQVISGIMRLFELSESDAASNANNILSNYHILNGEIIENSGFPMEFDFNKSKNVLQIKTENISHIEYIELLKQYIHCILCLYQREKEVHPSIESVALQKKIDFDVIEEKRIVPIDIEDMSTINNDFFDDSDGDDEEELFGMDEDEVYGGNGSEEIEHDVTNMKLKRPNPFQTRIEERDPKLILKESKGKFKQYSKFCPVSLNRQPVIIDNDDKQRIDKKHPGSYTTAVQYGSDPANEFWYICPRYWSLKTNTSLTQEEVDIILKKNPKAIIPYQSDVVPKDAFIYEFNNPKEHMNDKNEYIPHYPGLQFDAHPDQLGVPCCFKKPNKTHKKDDQMSHQLKTYVIDANKYPLPQQRLGFLPEEVCRYFDFDNARVISKTNPALIKPNTPCFLRYGCEQSITQSFLGCCAQIYSEVQELPVPPISEFRTIIADSIHIDNFIKFLQGSLVSIFRPKIHNVTVKHLEKYESSNFYGFMNLENKKEVDFLKETVASYENFQKYIRDEKATIDHTIMWNIFTAPNEFLFPNGINLFILETSKKDHVNLLCPMSGTIIDKKKPSAFILLQDMYYELICHYENKNKSQNIDKFFDFSTAKSTVQYAINVSEDKLKHCIPKKSIPFVKAKSAQNIDTVVETLKKYNIKVAEQVMDFRAYIIGLSLEMSGGNVYLPIYPSEYKYSEYETTLINDSTLWHPYETTKQMLMEVYDKTNGEIYCKPSKKILKNKKIIGISIETNQFIRTNDKLDYYDGIDDLEVDFDDDHIDADIQTSFNKEDKERIMRSKNVFLESQFYSIFRTTIRLLLDNPINQKIKSKILNILAKSDITYQEKITQLYYCFIELTKDYVTFGKPTIDDPENINTCFSNVDSKPSCVKQGSNVYLLLPEENLHDVNISNKMLYYMKICDEMIRLPAIRSFVIENGVYSNISNIEYNVHGDEILLIEDAMKSDFFNELNIFAFNHENKKLTFNIADPSVSEKYSNKIKF